MLDNISSVASSLGAKQVCAAACAVADRHSLVSHLVSDQQAVAACWRFLDDHRVLVEPACGAALAAVYDPVPALAGRKTILVVVCGGMGVSVAQLTRLTEDG